MSAVARDPLPQELRLDAIAAALSRDDDARALLALGSLAEPSRADRFSDLDFFAIVKDGAKPRFVSDLGWLAAAHPIAFSFRNTPDGHKVLFADGLFAEMAVFTVDELARIPFAPGRVVWARDDVDRARLAPTLPVPPPSTHGEDWLVSELLSCLLVGLSRDARGETLAALRLIQVHAVDLWLALEDQRARAREDTRRDDGRDPFNAVRRVEARNPARRAVLAALCPGYGNNLQAARALLALVAHDAHAAPPLVDAVRALLEPARR